MKTAKKISTARAFVFLLFSVMMILTACKTTVTEYAVTEQVQESSEPEGQQKQETLELPVRDGVTAQINYGLKHVVKSNRKTMVQALFRNTSPKPCSGKFRVWQQMSQEGQYRVYQEQISVGAESTEELELILIPSTSESVFFSFQEDGDRPERQTEKQMPNYLNGDVTLIGILANSYEFYSYLADDQAYVISLKQEDIPENEQGLEALDVLLIGDFDIGALGEKKKEAVRQYVENGGVLLIEERAFQALEKDGAEKWQWKKVPVQNPEASERMVEQIFGSRKEQSLYNKYTCKKGVILEFSETLRLPYEEWESNGPLIQEIAYREMGAEKKDQLLRESIYDDLSYMKTYSVNSIGENAPEVKNYVIILALYFFVAGPMCFLLLRHWEMQKLLWGIVPAFAVLFTFLIYVAGSGTRIVEPYVSYLTVVNNKDGVTWESTFFSVASPYNDSYQISAPSRYPWYMLDSDTGMTYYTASGQELQELESPNLLMYQEGDRTKVEVQNIASFTPLYFTEEHEREETLQVEGEVSYQAYDVSGSIENTLPFDLENVVLCVGETLVLVGDFPQDSKVSLGSCHQETVGNIGNLQNKRLIEKALGGRNPYQGTYNPELSRKYGAMQYALYQQYSTMQEKDSVLLGIRKGEDVPEFVADLGEKQTGLSIVSVQLRRAKQKKTFISNLDPYTSFYQSKINYYRDMQEDSIKATITFPENWNVVELWYSDKINGEFIKKYSIGFHGTVSLYNYRLGTYEVIFRGGEMKKLTDMEDYLNDKNELLLIYRNTNEQKNWMEIVPVLSAVVKEVD